MDNVVLLVRVSTDKQDYQRQIINPFTDGEFKYIFGREENKDLLKGFLNLLLESEVKIRDIHYLNTELLGYRPELKRCVVDVLATGREKGRAEGRAEGREEKQKEIARTMKDDGVSPELIAKYTGLSIEEAKLL